MQRGYVFPFFGVSELVLTGSTPAGAELARRAHRSRRIAPFAIEEAVRSAPSFVEIA